MRFLSICLFILGLASFSKETEDQQPELEETSIEDYDDVFQHLEEEEEDDKLQDSSKDDLQDASEQDFDAGLGEDSNDAFRNALQEAFRTWNANVKACNGDEACLARVNDVLRPIVNEAADNGVLSVIDPCEDRVGTYDVETVDGWIIEATLPC